MLAIIPDYDDSDSENSNQSDTEDKGHHHEDSRNVTAEHCCPGSDTSVTPENLRYPSSHSRAYSNLNSREGDHKDSQSPSEDSSLSSLQPEHAAVIRYLALKRRKDEELRALEEEASQLERRLESRKNRRKRKGHRSGDSPEEHSSAGSSKDTSSDHMKILSSYIGINDHLKGSLVDHGDLAPKSGLEKEIDEAVAAGDVDKAEKLSNYLVSRNFSVRVAEAANARDYSKRKKEEEEQRLAKKRLKKAKLAWGFEVKHRWEMKGNM